MVRTFAAVDAFGRLMADFPRPWFVSGGWAIDLFLDRVTRDHEDLEVGIFRTHQGLLCAHLANWRLAKAVPGQGWVPWAAGERLELPVFQILAQPPDDATPDSPEYEFFLNDVADGLWHFRRDSTITYPLSALVRRSARGLPIVAPEVQLLYKAKRHRPKDEHDFALAHGRLDPAAQAWLRAALTRHHPDDPWLARLAPPASAMPPEF